MVNFIKRYLQPKPVFFTGIVVLGAFVLSHTSVVQAFGGDTTADNPAAALAQFLSIVVNLLTFFIMLMINYMGDLFGVELIIGETPMQVIRPMWVAIRNITNIVFIGILLFLVFSNLFGISNWSVKEKLPKVIIALVAINFSLLGFRVVIDAINVGTVAVLSIPQDLMRNRGIGNVQEIMLHGYKKGGEPCETLSSTKDNGAPKWNPTSGIPQYLENKDPNKYPNHFKGTEDCSPFYARMNNILCDEVFDSSEAQTNDRCVFFIDPLQINVNGSANSMAAHNLMTAFAVYFFRIENLPALAGKIQSWDGVVMNVLFSTVMALAIIVALFAVFLVLLVRVVFLWIAMVFSPLFIAGAIMGIKGGGGDMTGKFVTHLLVPIKVAAVFAVTYIMMSAMVEFSTSNMQNEYMVMGPSLSIFGMGVSGLLWQVATIGIFWKAAFWAMDGTLAQDIVNKIKTGAESLAGIAGRWATIDRPILPGKDGKKNQVSLGAIANTPNLIRRKYNAGIQKNNERWADMIAGGMSPVEKAVGQFENAVNNERNFIKNFETLYNDSGKTQGFNENRVLIEQTIKKEYTEATDGGKVSDVNGWTQFQTQLAAGMLTADQVAEFVRGLKQKGLSLPSGSSDSDITSERYGGASSEPSIEAFSNATWNDYANGSKEYNDLKLALQADGSEVIQEDDLDTIAKKLSDVDDGDKLKAKLEDDRLGGKIAS